METKLLDEQLVQRDQTTVTSLSLMVLHFLICLALCFCNMLGSAYLTSSTYPGIFSFGGLLIGLSHKTPSS
jgi:hypothetical protein